MPGRRLLALADDLDDFVTNRRQVDTHAFEGPRGDAFALVEQPQKDVLGADVVVIEEPGFFLGQHHDPSGSVGEAFKHSTLLNLAYAILPSAAD